MLKISKKVPLVNSDNYEVGINFDGTVILMGRSEFHIHPTKLKSGVFSDVRGEYEIELSDDQIKQIKDILTAWIAEGNSIMDENTIRPL